MEAFSPSRATAFRGLAGLFCLLTVATPLAGQLAIVRDPPDTFYQGSLPFHYDLYTFRGDGGSTLVVASFAVPAGELEPEHRGGDVRYRFDITLTVADTLLRTVTRTDDSVFVKAPRRLPDDHLLFAHIAMEAAPSPTTVQRAIMSDATTPGAGQLHASRFPIPDYRGDRLMLSDIALGQPGAQAGWRRGDVTLALLPTSLFPESAFEVYYEVYNLPYGHPYTTEILVERLAHAGSRAIVEREPAIGLRFDGEARPGRDGTLQELRYVKGYLERGRYRLSVAVTDEETAETVTRSRIFEVRGWGRGTTLVVARPRYHSMQ